MEAVAPAAAASRNRASHELSNRGARPAIGLGSRLDARYQRLREALSLGHRMGDLWRDDASERVAGEDAVTG
jgi:hypothetical protein